MTCYRSKESLYHNCVQNQCHVLASCLQYKVNLNKLYLKERLANLFLPHVSLSSRGDGNWCWYIHWQRQVSPPFWAVHLCKAACVALQVPNPAIWVPLRFYSSLVSLALMPQCKPSPSLLEMCSQKLGCPQQSPGHLWPM